MNQKYSIIQVIQGSPEWLDLRLKYATASNVPAIQGISPYKTRLQYFEELFLNRSIPFKMNAAVKMGHEVEKIGRDYVASNYGFEINPAVVVSKDVPDLLASLDGFNKEREIIFEAKYVGSEALSMILERNLPEHHVAQVQSQLLATGAKKCIYFAQDPAGRVAIVEIDPNQKMIDLISKDVTAFMNDVRAGSFPEPSDQDFVPVEDPELATLKELKLLIDSRSEEFDEMKKRLDAKYKDVVRLKGNGIMMYRSTVKGSVQYAKIPEIASIDLEQYRGKSRSQVTFKLAKE